MCSFPTGFMQTHAKPMLCLLTLWKKDKNTLQLSDKFRAKVSPSILTQMSSTEVNGTGVLTLEGP